MANLIQFDNNYNENKLSTDSLLKNNPTINYNGNGTVTIVEEYLLSDKSNSLELFTVQDVFIGIDESFDFGSALVYTVEKTGYHAFQFGVNVKTVSSDPNYSVYIGLDVFVGGVSTYSFDFLLDLTVQNPEIPVFLAQSFNAIQGQELNFKFTVTAVSVGNPNPNFTLLFSSFKLENLNNSSNGLPSSWSLPKDYSSADGKETLGIYDYENTLTAQSFTGTPIKLLNNGLGANTNKTYALTGIAETFDTVTNELDFSNLKLGDKFEIRLQLEVTTTSVNQEVNMYINVAVGSGADYVIHLGREFFKTVGTYEINYLYNFIYIGNAETRDYPAEIMFNSDANATVLVGGFATIVNKRLL